MTTAPEARASSSTALMMAAKKGSAMSGTATAMAVSLAGAERHRKGVGHVTQLSRSGQDSLAHLGRDVSIVAQHPRNRLGTDPGPGSDIPHRGHWAPFVVFVGGGNAMTSMSLQSWQSVLGQRGGPFTPGGPTNDTVDCIQCDTDDMSTKEIF
jgi:hypothetical protein